MSTNYMVYIQSSKGRQEIPCSTEKEVWDAIGDAPLGACYQVSSPTKLATTQFIPF